MAKAEARHGSPHSTEAKEVETPASKADMATDTAVGLQATSVTEEPQTEHPSNGPRQERQVAYRSFLALQTFAKTSTLR